MRMQNFSKALKNQKDKLGMGATQVWRYRGGRVPKLLVWLVENPDLAEALAMDARELSSSRGIIVAHEQAA